MCAAGQIDPLALAQRLTAGFNCCAVMLNSQNARHLQPHLRLILVITRPHTCNCNYKEEELRCDIRHPFSPQISRCLRIKQTKHLLAHHHRWLCLFGFIFPQRESQHPHTRFFCPFKFFNFYFVHLL